MFCITCLDEPPSVSSQVWDKENGVYVHYLLGNKGAHITMGNIKRKNKNDKSKKLRINEICPTDNLPEHQSNSRIEMDTKKCVEIETNIDDCDMNTLSSI